MKIELQFRAQFSNGLSISYVGSLGKGGIFAAYILLYFPFFGGGLGVEGNIVKEFIVENLHLPKQAR